MRRVYLIIFDKPGRSLSGWHYRKLREFGGRWIQRSAIEVSDAATARELVEALREFGVREIRIFKAADITDYVGT